MPESYDLAIVGGGIIGVCAAAFAAEAGLKVALFEREDIAAGASGRNSGSIQYPFDRHMAELNRGSVLDYRELSETTDFRLPPSPAGLLLLSPDLDVLDQNARTIAELSPDMHPTVLDQRALHKIEPAIAEDLAACRLETGYPVAPAAATNAFAARARRAGATIEIGAAAEVAIESDRAVGLRLASGTTVGAGQVLIAAGPWTPALVPGWSERPPIAPLWGVVVSVAMAAAPRSVLEEVGLEHGEHPEELFSLMTAHGDVSVGSTFLVDEPDPLERAPRILEHATRFVPALAGARQTKLRVCARPVSVDGLPFIGAIPGLAGLFVCAGHGPWGISTGPASARLVVDEIMGREVAPTALSAARAGR